MFIIFHDVILDSGQSSERWYFDSFDEWLGWIEDNDDGRFTDEWMVEQAGYQLATYENNFDEYLFWNIRALDYMGAFTSSEIALLDNALERENAVRWWYYINTGKDLFPIFETTNPWASTEAAWSEYINSCGFYFTSPDYYL